MPPPAGNGVDDLEPIHGGALGDDGFQQHPQRGRVPPLDFIPLEPYFRQARQSGAIEVMEIDEGLFMLGLKAAGMRVPGRKAWGSAT